MFVGEPLEEPGGQKLKNQHDFIDCHVLRGAPRGTWESKTLKNQYDLMALGGPGGSKNWKNQHNLMDFIVCQGAPWETWGGPKH